MASVDLAAVKSNKSSHLVVIRIFFSKKPDWDSEKLNYSVTEIQYQEALLSGNCTVFLAPLLGSLLGSRSSKPGFFHYP